MDLQAIAKLTRESVSRLTSEEYLAAHNDEVTGKAFAIKVNEVENAPRTASPARTNGRVRADEPSTAPAQTQSFDPSFDGDDEAPAPVAAPAAAAQPAAAQPAAELPELIHRYQPVDRNGKKVGGEQV